MLRLVKDAVKKHPMGQKLVQPYGRLRFMLEIQREVARKRFWSLLDRKADESNLMINVGAGYFVRRHWRVLDFPSSWYNWVGGFIDYQIDLTADERWPLKDNSVSLYFTSHTLEHIPHEHAQHILGEIYRTLKPGRALRIVVPDFDLGYDAFGKKDISFFVEYQGSSLEERFLDFFATYLRERVVPDELWRKYQSMTRAEFADHFTQQIPRESQRERTGNHINWWNYDKASALLKKVGFKEVYRSTEQGSRFAEMRGKGRHTGFDSTHPELSLFVEAIK